VLRQDGRTSGQPAGGGGVPEGIYGGAALVVSGEVGGAAEVSGELGGGGLAVQDGHTVAVDVRVRVDTVEVD